MFKNIYRLMIGWVKGKLKGLAEPLSLCLNYLVIR